MLQFEGPLFEKQEEFDKLLEFKARNIDTAELLKKLPPSLRTMIPENEINQPGKFYEINMIHKIQAADGSIQEYKLPSAQESKGTQSLFFLSPLLKKAFEEGNVLFFDAIDTSLLPK